MQRKFVLNLLLLVFINLLVKPLWIFGIDRQIQNSCGPEQYGLYYALLNFSFLWNVILDMGITNFNNKSIAQHTQLLPKYLSNILIIKALLTFAYLIFTFLWAFSIGYTGYELYLLAVLAFNQVLNSLILYLRSNLAALHAFKTDSFISVLDKVLMILICAPLLLFSKTFDIAWFIYAQTIAFGLTALIAFFLVLRHTALLRFRWNFPLLLLIIKQCYPYALLSVLMVLYIRIDAVMLERLLPDGRIQVGYYAAAYRLLDAATMFAFLFSGLLLPIFSRMLQQKQDILALTRLSFSLLLLPCFILCIGCVFHADELMELLYTGDTARNSSNTFIFLMFALLGTSNTYIFGTLLTAHGSIRKLNQTAIIGLLVNIGLNALLIPIYKATGAAFVACITLCLVSLTHSLLAFRYFKLDFGRKYTFSFIGIVAFCVLSNYLAKAWIGNWMLAGLIAAIATLFCLLISGLIPIRDARKIFSKWA